MVTNLAAILEYLFPALRLSPRGPVRLVNRGDGVGPVIEQWDATLGAQPTQTALETAEASAGFQAYLAAKATAATEAAAVQTDLSAAAAQAIQDLDAFLALPSPTNAQNLAALRMLCQQQKRIIKRVVQLT